MNQVDDNHSERYRVELRNFSGHTKNHRPNYSIEYSAVAIRHDSSRSFFILINSLAIIAIFAPEYEILPFPLNFILLTGICFCFDKIRQSIDFKAQD